MKKTALLILLPLLICSVSCKTGKKKDSSSIESSSYSESISESSSKTSSGQESHTSKEESSNQSSSEPYSSSEDSSTDVRDDGVIAQVAYAASKYNSNMNRYVLAEKANIYEDTSLTRGQLFHLLRCAFEESMPKIIGARRYQGDFTTHKTSRVLSKSEQRDYDFLAQCGLIGEDFNPDLKNNASFTNLMLKRIHAYIGTSEVDDFAYTVNHEWLYDKDQYDGKTADEIVADSNLISEDILYDNAYELLKEASQTAQYSNLGYLVDAYENQRISYPTLDGAFENIYNVTNINSLYEITKYEFGSNLVSPLISFDAGVGDLYYIDGEIGCLKGYRVDYTEYLTLMMGSNYRCSYSSFYSVESYFINSRIDELVSKYSISSSVSNFLKENYRNFLKLVSDNCINDFYTGWENDTQIIQEGYEDAIASGSGDVYSLASLFDQGNIHFPMYLLSRSEYCLLNKIGSFLVDETNLASLKAYFFLNYLCELDSISLKYEEKITKKDVVLLSSYNILNYYQSTSRYSDAVSVTTDLFNNLIYTLKSNASTNGWLSANGVDAVIEKANRVRHSFYGEFDGQDLDYSVVKNVFGEEMIYNHIGYNANIARIWADFFSKIESGQMTFAEQMQLYMEPFTPNAYYFPYTNSIYITMGYLFSKGDNLLDYSLERLLATFGLVMGHETTHGFDSNGCYYDGDGNYTSKSIFPTSDLIKYENKQKDVVQLYNYEIMPGLDQSGTITLSEDLADIGGLGLCLGIASSVDYPFDYQEFYREIGQNFMAKASRQYYIEKVDGDVHAYSAGRLNPLMMARSEFMTAFDVKEWDGMYRNPDQEIIIW